MKCQLCNADVVSVSMVHRSKTYTTTCEIDGVTHHNCLKALVARIVALEGKKV